MRDRMANVGDYLNESVQKINGENTETGARTWDDENELKKALAESERVAALEAKNRRQGDDDLEKALQISQQEALEQEKKKQGALEKENSQNLFHGSFGAFPQQQVFNSPVNNPYQQQQQPQQPPLQLEWTQSSSFSEPMQSQQNNPYQQPQQQPQNPYLQNQFNATGLQAQMTGFGSPPIVPQQQPTMDFFSQQQGLQAQMTGFPSSPQPLFQQQQPQPSFQPQQSSFIQQPSFQTNMVTGTNPFSQMNGGQSQPMQPQQQHDYSGLVFGGNTSPQQQYTSASTPNFSFNTPVATAASPSPAFATTSAFSSPQPTQADLKFSKLNALLANKE